MSDKRILEFNTATEVGETDFVPVDSLSGGTRKVAVTNLPGGGGGGGTTVVPNPVGEPTAELETIKIGSIIYDIPGSGGSSDASVTTDILYQAENESGASLNVQYTYNGNKHLSDYDLCYIYVTVPASGDAPLFESHSFCPKNQLKPIFRVTGYGNRFTNITMTDTDFTVTAETGESWDYTYKVYTILGIKYNYGQPASYDEKLLYVNNGTTASNITLNSKLSNYDMLMFRVVRSSGDYIDIPYLTSELQPNDKITLIGYDNEYINYTVTDMKTLTLTASQSNYVSEVRGIRFGDKETTEQGDDFVDDVIYEDTTGQTGTQNITLSSRLDNYDAIYFEFYFPSEATYVTANPSPLQIVVASPEGASHDYFFQTYPSYGNRYITLESIDGGTNATLVASAWNDLNPSVYRIHGVKFTNTKGGGFAKTIYKANDYNGAPTLTNVAYDNSITLDGDEVLVVTYADPTDAALFGTLIIPPSLFNTPVYYTGYSNRVNLTYFGLTSFYQQRAEAPGESADYAPKVYQIDAIKIGGGRNYHVYDQHEKIVGEWFGEPLYEKTVVIKENGIDNYTYSSEMYQNCLPVSDFINITQMYAARGDTVGYVDVVSNQNEVYYVPNKNGDLFFKSSHSPTDIIVTVQYTKSTS